MDAKKKRAPGAVAALSLSCPSFRNLYATLLRNEGSLEVVSIIARLHDRHMSVARLSDLNLSFQHRGQATESICELASDRSATFAGDHDDRWPRRHPVVKIGPARRERFGRLRALARCCTETNIVSPSGVKAGPVASPGFLSLGCPDGGRMTVPQDAISIRKRNFDSPSRCWRCRLNQCVNGKVMPNV